MEGLALTQDGLLNTLAMLVGLLPLVGAGLALGLLHRTQRRRKQALYRKISAVERAVERHSVTILMDAGFTATQAHALVALRRAVHADRHEGVSALRRQRERADITQMPRTGLSVPDVTPDA